MSDVFEVFLHNWASSVTMTTAWQTAIAQGAEELTEDRASLCYNPRRSLTVRWQARSKAQSQRLLFTLQRMAYQRLRVPLYQDASLVTANTAGDSTLYFDTTGGRRIDRDQAGAPLVAFAIGSDGMPANVQWLTVDTAFNDHVLLTTNPTVTKGSVVMPWILAELVFSGPTGNADTDHHLSVEATFEEVQASALPPAIRFYNDLLESSAVDAHGNTLFALDATIFDWSQQPRLGIMRAGRQVSLGIQAPAVARGPRPQLTLELMVMGDRDTFARALQWFDAHRGMLRPFVLQDPLTIWTAIAVADTTVDVTAAGAIDDAQAFPQWVWFDWRDGTHAAAPITGVIDHTTYFRVAFANLSLSGLGKAIADVARVTVGHLVRFSEDALTEEWQTNAAASVSFHLLELVDELDPVWS